MTIWNSVSGCWNRSSVDPCSGVAACFDSIGAPPGRPCNWPSLLQKDLLHLMWQWNPSSQSRDLPRPASTTRWRTRWQEPCRIHSDVLHFLHCMAALSCTKLLQVFQRACSIRFPCKPSPKRTIYAAKCIRIKKDNTHIKAHTESAFSSCLFSSQTNNHLAIPWGFFNHGRFQLTERRKWIVCGRKIQWKFTDFSFLSLSDPLGVQNSSERRGI